MSLPEFAARSDLFATQLALNLDYALNVAGPAASSGRPSRLSSVAVNKQTGIARSTLRNLTRPAAGEIPRPDLHTLSRLADVIGIPLPFLLMRAEDWHTLCDVMDFFPAMYGETVDLMKKEVAASDLSHMPERLLRHFKLHTDTVPPGIAQDAPERGKFLEQNEKRRRASHVLGRLMLRSALEEHKPMLATLAAAIAHQLSYNADRSAAAVGSTLEPL
jgi:hypothetical protein